MKNVFTVDVEDWYMTQDLNLDIKNWGSFEDRIEAGTDKILDLLARYGVRATFFVLGCVAEKHPEMLRRIAHYGHEIGSHGGWHKMISKMTPTEFRKDLQFSKCILENITGREVTCFRAPSWSISRESLWALQILEQEGFTCDSSLQPFRTPLSGMKGVPKKPFRPVIEGNKLNIIELPSTVLNCKRINFPFSGGLYLRVLPYSFIAYALRKVNTERMGTVYIHPWETDVDQPRMSTPYYAKLTHYYNWQSVLIKIEKLLNDFRFIPICEALKGGDFPHMPIDKDKSNDIDKEKVKDIPV